MERKKRPGGRLFPVTFRGVAQPLQPAYFQFQLRHQIRQVRGGHMLPVQVHEQAVADGRLR